MWKPEIPPGSVFDRWTVVCREGSNKRNERLYRCRCKCGVEKLVSSGTLTSGQSRSCGCHKIDVKRAEKTTHGKSETGTYRSWHNMLQRCNNPNNTHWKNYGGRGLTVDPRWHSFDAFLADMGDRPDGATIERVDNEKGYGPDNCVWATRKQQQRNRRPVRMYELDGVVGTVGDHAEAHGVSYMSMWHKLRNHTS